MNEAVLDGRYRLLAEIARDMRGVAYVALAKDTLEVVRFRRLRVVYGGQPNAKTLRDIERQFRFQRVHLGRVNGAVIGTLPEQFPAPLERIFIEFPVQPAGEPICAVVQCHPHQFVADECSIEQARPEYIQPLRKIMPDKFPLQCIAFQRGQVHPAAVGQAAAAAPDDFSRKNLP